MLTHGLFWRTLFAVLLSFLLVGCGGSNSQQRSSKQGSTQTSQATPQVDKKAVYAEINALLDLDLVKKEQDRLDERLSINRLPGSVYIRRGK